MTTILDKLEDASIFAWILKNNIKNENGEPLDFHKYRFLKQIYADRSPLMVCMKAAQIGFSTYEILKTAFDCRNERLDTIYVLPSDDDVTRFSAGKTNKIILQNPVLQQWTKDKDSTYQKQFGSNTIYYEGAWTERAALSTTAKKLVVDEYDRCKPSVVNQYDSRLQSVAEPRKAFFSNPSLKGRGVHVFYSRSDQKKWHITHACGKQYVMDEDCIDYEAEIYRCPFCKEEIIDEERRMGEWIATAKGEWSGYWIPLWIAPWMPASKIAEQKRDKDTQYFANFVAGLPYAGSNNEISEEQVLQNVSDTFNSQQDRVIIGVDTGLPIWYVLMNKEGVFHANKCEPPSANYDPYKHLEGFLLRWPQSIIVIDQGGDPVGTRYLQSKYPGRVFICFYRQDRKTNQITQWGEGNKFGEVVVDRDRMLSLVIEQLRAGDRIMLNGTKEEWKPFAEHFSHLLRIVEDTPFGPKYTWERHGADHLAHAFLYAAVGFDHFGGLPTVVSTPDWMKELPTSAQETLRANDVIRIVKANKL